MKAKNIYIDFMEFVADEYPEVHNFYFGYVMGSLITTLFFVIGDNWSSLYLPLKIFSIILLILLCIGFISFNQKN